MHLPEIVNVDVSQAVIDQAALGHGGGGGFDVFRSHGAAETIPTVPTHDRRQADLRAANDFEWAFCFPVFIFRAQQHRIFTGLF